MNFEVLCAFIEAGADVNAKDKNGKTALMIAAQNTISNAVRVLIDAGADVNVKDNNGKTALMIAVCRNYEFRDLYSGKKKKRRQAAVMAYYINKSLINILNSLIEAGADINAKDHDGRTALMIATEHGNGRNHEVLSILAEAEQRSAGSAND